VRTRLFLVVTVVTAACSAGATPTVAPTSSRPSVSTAPSVAASVSPVTVATTTIPTLPPSTTTLPPTTTTTTVATTTATTAVDSYVLAGISMTSVPPDVIVPTSPASLEEHSNPINGARGGRHPLPDAPGCPAAATAACLTYVLDTLGFDVTSGSDDERSRHLQRATAVVQLDAGLPMTGEPDEALLRYMALIADPASGSPARETRQIGTSAQGRPITAVRYGDGPRTVLVVGQTHGDEEGGLRVLLRARTLPVPDGITLWVVPTMNPDGLAFDTRFLAGGADPNRQAPSQPEQRTVYEFAQAIRPTLSIWYHQNYGWVGGSGASMTPARRYQALTHLGTLKRSGDCAVGFMWCPIDDALASSSILVELPDVLTPADVQLHAGALLTVAAGDQS
jgi:protein MpaA